MLTLLSLMMTVLLHEIVPVKEITCFPLGSLSFVKTVLRFTMDGVSPLIVREDGFTVVGW